MNEIAFIAMVLFYAGRLGFWLGTRAEGKRLANKAEMADTIICQAKGIKDTRKLVGDGPAITNSMAWAIGDIGKFTVTVEEHAATNEGKVKAWTPQHKETGNNGKGG